MVFNEHLFHAGLIGSAIGTVLASSAIVMMASIFGMADSCSVYGSGVKMVLASGAICGFAAMAIDSHVRLAVEDRNEQSISNRL
jgi:hypothetical protein